MKRQAENFHVVVGMTRLIKMPSYWFGDVLAVVFHIQKMFAARHFNQPGHSQTIAKKAVSI